MGTVIYLIFMIAALVGGWKMYEKAGKPGWAIIVPFYNLMTLMEIIGKPKFWWLWMIVPVYNIYILYKVSEYLTKSYGLEDGYKWLCFFVTPVFYLIAGFKEDVKYVGPAAAEAQA